MYLVKISYCLSMPERAGNPKVEGRRAGCGACDPLPCSPPSPCCPSPVRRAQASRSKLRSPHLEHRRRACARTSKRTSPCRTRGSRDGKEHHFNLPKGLFGNPNAIRNCASSDFSLDQCPAVAQAGLISVRGNYEGTRTTSSAPRRSTSSNRAPRTGDRALRVHRPDPRHPDQHPDRGADRGATTGCG